MFGVCSTQMLVEINNTQDTVIPLQPGLACTRARNSQSVLDPSAQTRAPKVKKIRASNISTILTNFTLVPNPANFINQTNLTRPSDLINLTKITSVPKKKKFGPLVSVLGPSSSLSHKRNLQFSLYLGVIGIDVSRYKNSGKCKVIIQ